MGPIAQKNVLFGLLAVASNGQQEWAYLYMPTFADGRKAVSAHTLGDAPIEPEFHAQMNAIAESLDEVFNGQLRHPHKTTGFVLLTFKYGSRDGRCNFISNGADRQDIVVLFREMIARFEGQPETSGRA